MLVSRCSELSKAHSNCEDSNEVIEVQNYWISKPSSKFPRLCQKKRYSMDTVVGMKNKMVLMIDVHQRNIKRITFKGSDTEMSLFSLKLETILLLERTVPLKHNHDFFSTSEHLCRKAQTTSTHQLEHHQVSTSFSETSFNFIKFDQFETCLNWLIDRS
ncbi:uncharacterized protein [Rutidosis leptorrhynchoides]|uniref:uncharacterized protein n=1 Tax=Rutidosis leptorrhynchoides TaxID=125765 RepID=UPI003A9A1BBB